MCILSRHCGLFQWIVTKALASEDLSPCVTEEKLAPRGYSITRTLSVNNTGALRVLLQVDYSKVRSVHRRKQCRVSNSVADRTS